MGRRLAEIAVALVLAVSSSAAAQPVDLELVLLADASGSIDSAEIEFQRRGYAEALTNPSVLSAMTGGVHQRIAITYVEWGDASSQDVVVPWTVIDGEAAAASFAGALLSMPRKAQGRNAIGNALAAGQRLIETNAHEGERKVIDFSADSANSWGGIPLEVARQSALAAGITINGLAVYCRICSGPPVSYDLKTAFEALIIGGPGSFVVAADGREPFAAAVRRKLLLEIAGIGMRPVLIKALASSLE